MFYDITCIKTLVAYAEGMLDEAKRTHLVGRGKPSPDLFIGGTTSGWRRVVGGGRSGGRAGGGGGGGVGGDCGGNRNKRVADVRECLERHVLVLLYVDLQVVLDGLVARVEASDDAEEHQVVVYFRVAGSEEGDRVAEAGHVAFDGIARLHLALVEGAEIIHHRGAGGGSVSFAELRHHLETLLLELGVEVEAVGGAVGEGQQEHGADAGACGLICRGGGEVITFGREGLVFKVGVELAIEVTPLHLTAVEGPELERS